MLSINFPFVLGIDVGEVVLVCDNAPCHNTVDELKEGFPGLNSSVIGALLAYVKSSREHLVQDEYVKRHMRVLAVARLGVREQRLQYVEQNIDNAMATIDHQDCNKMLPACSRHF